MVMGKFLDKTLDLLILSLATALLAAPFVLIFTAPLLAWS